MEITTFERLTGSERCLVEEAEKVREHAYNPYSRFYVGAALLAQTKEIITGANVENASYGLSICAERAALLRANAMRIRK